MPVRLEAGDQGILVSGDDEEWQPTPDGLLFWCERWNGSAWESVLFRECHVGDVVRFFSPEGDPIHPETRDFIEDGARHPSCVLESEPFKTWNWAGAGAPTSRSAKVKG